MDRHNRGGDRDGNRHYSRMSGRSSSDRYPNPNNSHHHQQPNYRGGGGGGGFSEPHNTRPFNNSHHHNHNQPFGGAPDFRPTAADGGSGGGGFGGGGFSGGGFGGGFQSGPMSGQKRSITGGFPSSGRSHSPNRGDSGNFAKLFIGSVPRTATEEDIRPLFEDQGNVIEVALIKDKRTGQQQGCCFIKYATSEEADQAIRALHNQVTLPGGSGPIQVRYADGERERLGKFQSANEYKLFVGSLNKQATEKEVEEIFSPYGHVEDVYIMRDELKQSRGCGFVKYSHRDMAAAAINALNGIYLMRGCDQPLTVRFADPKRPRAGESRFGPAFGGPGFGSRSQPPLGVRPVSNADDSLHIPPNAWQPMSPQSGGLSSQVTHAFGSHFPVKGGVGPMSSLTASSMGSLGMSTSGSLSGISSTLSSASQQGYSSMPQIQSFGHQISPLQKPIQSPQHLPSSLQLNSQQNTSSFSQSQGHISQTPIQQFNQIQAPHSIGQPSLGGHALTFGLAGQQSVSQPLVQPSGPQQVPFNLPNLQQSHLPTNNPSSSIQQSQLLQPIQQVPSQGQLQQQVQTLHSGFQSTPPPQQAYSMLQQQLHLMKQTPSTQSLSQQQNLHAPSKTQSAWTGILPQAVVSTPAASPAVVTSSTISSSGPSAVPIHTTVAAPLTCNWTEHTSPEGYKYYYNSVTGESRWEKPEELSLFEQQQLQQKLLLQQQQQKILVPQLQSQNQAQTHNQVVQSPQQISHAQHLQLQTQLRQQQQQIQVQQPSLSSSYQPSGAIGHQHIQDFAYGQLQPTNASVIDQARLQQGIQAAHERMWKTKPSGT